MTHQLLLEIGLEEQPARFIPASEKQLKENTAAFLKEARLNYGKIESFSSPRRLAVLVHDLAEKQEDLREEVRGPARSIAQDSDGQWTKAAEGFARGQAAQTDDIYFVEEKGQDYAYVEKFVEGKASFEILKNLDELVTSLHFPVSMRWARHKFEYIRPIHWITALLDDQIIPFKLLDIESGNQLEGHRFLGESIHLQSAADYEQALEEQYVIPNRLKRQAMIKEQIKALEEAEGFVVDKDQDLLEEVTDLVEYPTAFMADFSQDYLKLPEEILITSMKDHQRYFAVRDQKGQLLNYFISVRNGDENYLDQVIDGNKKVISARLDDAMFFYQEDQKISLKQYVDRLDHISFYQSLGNMTNKIDRIRVIAQILAEKFEFSSEQKEIVDRAAQLSKFDLSTLMVNEFTELQGLMGAYYAEAAGEDQPVVQAIAEQYLPNSSQGRLPQSKEGAVLALADKIDSILMFFAAGQIPTGSNDPFALRRQAYGVLRIILKGSKDFSFAALIEEIQEKIPYPNNEIKEQFEEEKTAVLHFIKERIRHYLEKEGIDHDIIEAVLASSQDNIHNLVDNARLLNDHYHDPDHRQLIESLSRIVNLRPKVQEELADQLKEGQVQIDESLFESESEEQLYQAYLEFKGSVSLESSAEEYYQQLRKLEPAINAFFDHNLVMHEDTRIRHNRLALIYALSELILQFAHLKKLSFK